MCFGIVDMQAARSLVTIARRLAAAILSRKPEVLVTHDYAGGHPDHDALAWAARAATRLLEARRITAPRIIEIPVYHGADGSMRRGEFVPRPEPVEASEFVLSKSELERKHAMLDAFVSQREMLRPFYELDVERYRLAPNHDFREAPHEGPLLYERWGFPLTGAQWRELAAAAALELETSS